MSWLFCFVCWNWVACKIHLTQVGAVVFTRIFTLGKGYVAHLLEPWKTYLPFKENWALLCSEMTVGEIHVSWRVGDYDPWTVGTIVCCGDTQLATNLKCVLFWLQVSTPIRFKDQAIVLIISLWSGVQIILAKWQGFNCFKWVSVQFNAESKKFPLWSSALQRNVHLTKHKGKAKL